MAQPATLTIDDPLGNLSVADLELIGLVAHELTHARGRFPNMNSPHEGYAVIKEELDEFWAECTLKPSERDSEVMRRELIQVAAMAIRTASDVAA